MDKQALVREIRNALTKFMQDKFKINMAMLIKDLERDTYTFIIAAKFLDLLTPYYGTKLIAEYFYNSLSKEAFSIISRINVVSTMDSSVQLIMRNMRISGIANMKNINIANNIFNVRIDDGIILESQND